MTPEQPVGPTGTPPRQRRGRRLLNWLVVIVLLLIGLIGGCWVVYLLISTSRLDQARAEADRLDPGWRWDELQAKREVIPDAENAAIKVEAIFSTIPAGWPVKLQEPRTVKDKDGLPATSSLDESTSFLNPVLQLPPEYYAALRADLEQIPAVVAEARKLADTSRGRIVVAPHEDYQKVMMTRMEQFRTVGNLLHYDARRLAQDRDGDGALHSTRGILSTGRAIGDEPYMILQLVRFALESISLAALERTLAMTEPTEKELTALQQLLENELDQPLLLIAMRGERAWQEKDGYGYDQIAGADPLTVPFMTLTGWHHQLSANVLEIDNEVVELAKRPLEEQPEAFRTTGREVDQRMRKTSGITRSHMVVAALTMPALSKVAEAHFRSRARLGSGVLAIAAERYRIKHGRWPETVEELAPLVRKVPIDPYGKGPLRLRRTDYGLVIYSVANDGEDNGGKLDDQGRDTKGTDLGFRLWDVPKRRQEWKPPAPP